MGVEHLGPLLWSGSAEIFRLKGCDPAERAFAWSWVEGQQLHCYVLLESDEISSARDAVRHVLSEQLEEQETGQPA